jgi:(2Fe-2S) ferredoxin
VNEIIEQHLIGGRPVERLRMRLRREGTAGLPPPAEKPQ